MAVQFPCPSCQQPIEVDDNWAGQAVACPYCRRVVTAPRESNWPPADVPVASPARNAFAPPPPPPGYSDRVPHPRTTANGPSSAAWALVLAVSAAVLWFVGMTVWSAALVGQAMNQLGPTATPEQVQRLAQEIARSGAFPVSNGAIAILSIGIVCGIAAVVLAFRSMFRSEGRPLKVVLAVVIALLFIACQGLMLALVSKTVPIPTTHPSTEIHSPPNTAND